MRMSYLNDRLHYSTSIIYYSTIIIIVRNDRNYDNMILRMVALSKSNWFVIPMITISSVTFVSLPFFIVQNIHTLLFADEIATADLNYSIPINNIEFDSLFIFPQLDPITLEVGLFLDSQLYRHFQAEYSTQDAEQHLLDFSLALINNVYVLYQQPTLSPNLDLVIVRYELWKTQPVCVYRMVQK